jgi:rubredoxin
MPDYQCGVCGYLYELSKGDPEASIAPNTAFNDLPADFGSAPFVGPAKTCSRRFHEWRRPGKFLYGPEKANLAKAQLNKTMKLFSRRTA